VRADFVVTNKDAAGGGEYSWAGVYTSFLQNDVSPATVANIQGISDPGAWTQWSNVRFEILTSLTSEVYHRYSTAAVNVTVVLNGWKDNRGGENF
jgi:hypothetical protein